jgi:uroporphyrinogen decarboxylase
VVGEDVPVIQTINPLSSEESGWEGLAGAPAPLSRKCMLVCTYCESTRRFTEAAMETGISGIFYAVQHAQFGLLSRQEYQEFGRSYDMQVLEPARASWLNLLHLHGEDVMFDEFLDYPMAAINWHDRETPPTLAEAKSRCSAASAICGVVRRWC